MKEKIIIRDSGSFEEKKAKIKKGGKNNLHIVNFF